MSDSRLEKKHFDPTDRTMPKAIIKFFLFLRLLIFFIIFGVGFS